MKIRSSKYLVFQSQLPFFKIFKWWVCKKDIKSPTCLSYFNLSCFRPTFSVLDAVREGKITQTNKTERKNHQKKNKNKTKTTKQKKNPHSYLLWTFFSQAWILVLHVNTQTNNCKFLNQTTCTIRGGSTYGPNRHCPPPFWQINHANSAYFRLFLGYFRVISATWPPLLDLGPPLFTYPRSAPYHYVPGLNANYGKIYYGSRI